MGKAMAAVYVSQGMEAGNALMKGSETSPGFDKASEVLLTHMATFRQREVAEARHLAANAEKTAATMSVDLVAAGLLACVLAALIAAWVVRSILQLLGGEPSQAVQLAQRVGAGDLSVAIELRPGDMTSLMAELKTMQQRLSTVDGPGDATKRRAGGGDGHGSQQLEHPGAGLGADRCRFHADGRDWCDAACAGTAAHSHNEARLRSQAGLNLYPRSQVNHAIIR